MRSCRCSRCSPDIGGVSWQLLQPLGKSLMPFTCVALRTLVAVYPGWQRRQSESCGCGSGGGAPWQVVQVTGAGFVQVGL